MHLDFSAFISKYYLNNTFHRFETETTINVSIKCNVSQMTTQIFSLKQVQQLKAIYYIIKLILLRKYINVIIYTIVINPT